MIVTWALNFALVAVSLATLLALWRVLRGPETVDRVLGLDTLYVNAVALVILLGLSSGTALLFEAALVIAMLGFVATVAVARFISRGDVIE